MINLEYVRETFLVFLQQEKRTPSIHSVLSQKSYRNTNILVYMYSIFSPNEREILSYILLRNTIAKGFLNQVINLIRSFIPWILFIRVFSAVT